MANLILELWRAGEVAQQLGAGAALQRTWVQFAAPTCSSQSCVIQLQGSKALFWSPEVPSIHVISRHTCQQNSYTHQIVILRNFSKLKKQKVKTLTANGEVCESFFPHAPEAHTSKDKSSFPVSAQEVCTAQAGTVSWPSSVLPYANHQPPSFSHFVHSEVLRVFHLVVSSTVETQEQNN